MFLIGLTFLLTTALYGILLGLAIRRVSRHLQQNPKGVEAVTTHVLIPLLGRRPPDEDAPPAKEPETPNVAGGMDSAAEDAATMNGAAARKGRNRHGPGE